MIVTVERVISSAVSSRHTTLPARVALRKRKRQQPLTGEIRAKHPSSTSDASGPYENTSASARAAIRTKLFAHSFASNTACRFQGCRLPSSFSAPSSVISVNFCSCFCQTLPQNSFIKIIMPGKSRSRAAPDSRTVFVGNIPYEVKEDELSEILQLPGPFENFRLQHDQQSKESKGFGFCTYRDPDVAASALRNLNSFDKNGRPIKVNLATDARSGANLMEEETRH